MARLDNARRCVDVNAAAWRDWTLAPNARTWQNAVARQLRLGVGAIGSIPTWLCFFLAFVVLVIVRSASLVLGNAKPDDCKNRSEGGSIVNKVRKAMSVVLETAWAVGGSILAGAPLLT